MEEEEEMVRQDRNNHALKRQKERINGDKRDIEKRRKKKERERRQRRRKTTRNRKKKDKQKQGISERK